MDFSMMGIYICGFPCEMMIALIAFALPLKKREDWLRRLPPALLALGGCILLDAAVLILLPMLPTGSVTPQQVYPAFFAFHYVLICMALIWGVHRVFDVSWNEALYCLVCTYIVEHMAYCIENLLNHFVPFPAGAMPRPLTWLLKALLYVTMYFVFVRRMCEDGHYATNAVQSAGLMTAVFVLVYVISLIAIDYGLEWLHACYALICCSFMLISEYRYTRRIRTERELRDKEQLWQRNRAQYELSTAQIDAINRKCHDLKHQINALRAMDDPRLRDEAIAGMEEAVMFYDSTYQTGNRTLDMVLTQKALICNQLEIPLSVIADGSALRFMDDIDLYTLIANILDNAIEANARIADPGHRFIGLAVHARKGLVILQAENPFVGELKLKDGLPLTSKTDTENHGFGTRSIAFTAQKYDGLLSIQAEHGMFVLRVAFPQSDEKRISGRKSA